MIARGKIRKILTAGSLAMCLKKAAAELEGKEFNIGLSEDPAHKDKPYYIPRERIEQAKKMISEGRAKGIEFIMPVDSVLQDGQVSETIGPGNQQFDVGPASSALYDKKVGEFIAAHKNDAASVTVFHNGVFGMFEDPRFEEGTKKFTAQLKRMKDAGFKVYVGGGEGGTAVGKIRQTRLDHLLLHRRRHGAERPGQRTGAVSGRPESRRRSDGTETARISNGCGKSMHSIVGHTSEQTADRVLQRRDRRFFISSTVQKLNIRRAFRFAHLAHRAINSSINFRMNSLGSPAFNGVFQARRRRREMGSKP